MDKELLSNICGCFSGLLCRHYLIKHKSVRNLCFLAKKNDYVSQVIIWFILDNLETSKAGWWLWNKAS